MMGRNDSATSSRGVMPRRLLASVRIDGLSGFSGFGLCSHQEIDVAIENLQKG